MPQNSNNKSHEFANSLLKAANHNEAAFNKLFDTASDDDLNKAVSLSDDNNDSILFEILCSELSSDAKITLIDRLSTSTINTFLSKQEAADQYSLLMHAFFKPNNMEDSVICALLQKATYKNLNKVAKLTGSSGTTLLHLLLSNTRLYAADEALLKKLKPSVIKTLIYKKNSNQESPLDCIVDALFKPRPLSKPVISLLRYLSRQTLHILFNLIVTKLTSKTQADTTLSKIRSIHPDFFNVLIQRIPELAHSKFLSVFCEDLRSSQFLVAQYPHLIKNISSQEYTGWRMLDKPINWVASYSHPNNSLYNTLVLSNKKNQMDAKSFLTLFDYLPDMLPAIILDYLDIKYIYNVTLRTYIVAISPKYNEPIQTLVAKEDYFPEPCKSEHKSPLKKSASTQSLSAFKLYNLFSKSPVTPEDNDSIQQSNSLIPTKTRISIC